jgi:hypothetical protein
MAFLESSGLANTKKSLKTQERPLFLQVLHASTAL